VNEIGAELGLRPSGVPRKSSRVGLALKDHGRDPP